MKKISSRKFIASMAGVLTGIGVIASGSEVEGIIAVLASVIAYLITEGFIDAKAVDVLDEVIDKTKDKLDGSKND
ncbi:MAG: hypothetical protein J6K12_05285 [Clostridia bacterium]|nr:hypothetical protein [Clostridia bacterium]